MNLFILTKCGCPIWRQYYIIQLQRVAEARILDNVKFQLYDLIFSYARLYQVLGEEVEKQHRLATPAYASDDLYPTVLPAVYQFLKIVIALY
jgi:hypothetical protein